MSRQELSGTFQVPILQDFVTPVTANGPLWTPGSTIAQPTTPQPQINSNWTVISLTLSGYLTLAADSLRPPKFGKLGKIVGALTLDIPLQPGNFTSNPPLQPLPPDLSLSGSMWDPTIDPLPPLFSSGGTPNPLTCLPISTVISPPVPLEIIAGKTIWIGVWMFPSLLGLNAIGLTNALEVVNPNYSLVYDDGL
jgi:hypothetical protein